MVRYSEVIAESQGQPTFELPITNESSHASIRDARIPLQECFQLNLLVCLLDSYSEVSQRDDNSLTIEVFCSSTLVGDRPTIQFSN
ncbi:hypothetical protein HDF12_003109 [Edaphobacter lichenicola]|uniref:Uncharacterized protein n=1 Tax=Tunturiibacter lichenicola TaxID=2051959 RepID=A0A7Y9TB09_9BACT|nr:hypothetical protein [Edaphobacter lichenicola]